MGTDYFVMKTSYCCIFTTPVPNYISQVLSQIKFIQFNDQIFRKKYINIYKWK
jgi:hypothetical protein